MTADSTIVEEVRRRRSALSAQFEHDVYKYAEHLRQIQAENASRVVSQLTVVPSTTTAGPGKLPR
jgi:DNA-directed RNA polymerase subunit F